MWVWFAGVVLALGFAAAATWVTGRVLDTTVSWVRGMVSGVIVFVVCLPALVWALNASDVLVDGRVAVSGPVGGLFLLLAFGWLFAVLVAVLVSLEVVWPRSRWNPYRTVKLASARRHRHRRYVQILRLLSRRGAAFRRAQRRGEDPSLPAEVTAALAEAGVTFVKLGQVLSTRDDMLPHDLASALATLQMDVAPIPWPEARAAIGAELHRPLDEVFGHIDEAPLAAASLAQVHAASLVDGTPVVVKIQRPDARDQVLVDLDILERLADDAETQTEWVRDYGARALAAEFSRALREEMDYRIEASNTELMRATFANAEHPLRVPRVFSEVTTSRMLVEERVIGIPLSRIGAAHTVDPDQSVRIADQVVDSVFEQIAVRGVFHADLHPGNVILGDDGEIWLIDFGAVGILEKSLRRLLVALLLAIVNEDDAVATDVLLLLVDVPEGADTAALQRDVGVILTRVRGVHVGADIFLQLIEVLRRHRLALPPPLLIVFRTMGSLDGTLRRLSPEYGIVDRGRSRTSHFARSMNSPQETLLTLQTYAVTVGEGLRRLPRRIEKISSAVADGTLSVRVRPFESAGARSWISSLASQFTTTFIGVALVAIAVFLMVFGSGPLLTGDVRLMPFLGAVIGLGGFLLVLRSLRRGLARSGSRADAGRITDPHR